MTQLPCAPVCRTSGKASSDPGERPAGRLAVPELASWRAALERQSDGAA